MDRGILTRGDDRKSVRRGESITFCTKGKVKAEVDLWLVVEEEEDGGGLGLASLFFTFRATSRFPLGADISAINEILYDKQDDNN